MDVWGITAIGHLLSLLGAAPGGSACLELAALDLQRSAAHASASPERLRDLFVDEQAAAGEVDDLREWIERGYVVESAMLVIGSCRVVEQTGDTVTLEVVDRLAPAFAVDELGQRHVLPRDGWSMRTITLRQVDGEWHYAGVE